MDKYFYLPRESSSEYGRWRTSRLPPIRKIAKALSIGSFAREIVIMKGNQIFITTLGIGWKLYGSDCDPGPFLYSQKTDDAVRDYVKQKLEPTIKACDRVAKILGKNKPAEYANSWDLKGFPGGFVTLGGATDSFFRSSSIGRAFPDEEDTYDLSIGQQGSPILILKKRMVNFPESKLLRASTPVNKELSTIEPAWEEGSQERFYIPCPHCNSEADHGGNMFWIQWPQIRWSEDMDPITEQPKRVWLECPYCAEEIDEGRHKTWMLDNGDWFSEKRSRAEHPDWPDDAEFEREKVGDVENPSFHLSALYSPVGFFSWSDAVKEWLHYQKTRRIEDLQVFINQTLAETFHLQGSEISYGYLESRRESYAGNIGRFSVPKMATCLTAGVDIQDDRIEAEVVGWGEFEESWSIDYVVLPGDTAIMGDAYGMLPDGRPGVWRLLDEYLYKKWKHETGVDLPIEMTMIDTGHMTENVHLFCRNREGRNIYPLKGEGGSGKGLYKRSTRRHEKYATVLYHAYVDDLKTKLYHYLQINNPGPGFCHFPKNDKYGDKYFKGLTCERRVPKVERGRKIIKWVTPSGARNEPIDVRNYATVAFLSYPVDMAARAAAVANGTFGKAPGRPAGRPRRSGSKGL